ncbi:MAG: AgmX/PglI C-terminal domain-containing protein, partial [Myxococcota bacterium]|nr:AgmX/PglI C-terminal domain-containing protein [Myxococcota bacterium]
ATEDAMTNTTKTTDRLAPEALEVVLTWGQSPLAQQLVSDGAVTLGPEGCTFLMPEEIVKQAFELARRDERGWTMHDGTPLAKDDVTTRTFGDFTFHLRVIDAPETTPRAGVQVDRQTAGFVGAVFGLASILVALSMLLPPNAAALTARLDGTQAHRLRVQLEALAATPVTETLSNDAGGEDGAHGGDAVASPSGGGGEPGPQQNTGRSVMRRGTRATASVTAESVRELGTFAAVRAFAEGVGDAGSPFGEVDSTGRSWLAAQGPLGGDGFHGGLRMDSTGVGTCEGERCSDGAVRSGDLIGRPGDDVRGHRPGPLGPRDRDGNGVPEMRPGRPEVTGGLSRTDIQRVVRRHKPEVAFCYEQALQSRPDLEGRVVVRFVVTPTGTVQSAMASAADGMSERVASCVSESVERWTFPASAGVTAVTYPFVLATH